MKWNFTLVLYALLTASLASAGHKKNKALRTAADDGNYEKVVQLIDAGVDVNDASSSGLTSLHYAVRSGNEKVVDVLIKKGARLEVADENGRTPLHMTLHKGQASPVLVKILLQAGANVNAQDSKGDTLLHYATRNKKVGETIVAAIFETSVDSNYGPSLMNLNALNDEGLSPLHQAAFYGCNEMLEKLIKHGAALEQKNKLGQTPLRLAVEKDHHKTTRLLLKAGANIHSADNEGMTSLQWAEQNGLTEMVKLLIKRGASYSPEDNETLTAEDDEEGRDVIRDVINAVDEEGWTLLHRAAHKSNYGEVKTLIEYGANLELKIPYYQCTALRLAVEQQEINIIEALIKAGADINSLDHHGVSSLHSAASTGKDSVVKKLIEYKANLDLKLPSGQTALMVAAGEQHFNIIKDLIDAGADVNAASADGVTVLDDALDTGNNDIIALLRKHGAKQATSDVISKVWNTAQRFWGTVSGGIKDGAQRISSTCSGIGIAMGVGLFIGLLATQHRIYHYQRYPIASDLSVPMASQYDLYQRNMDGPQ